MVSLPRLRESAQQGAGPVHLAAADGLLKLRRRLSEPDSSHHHRRRLQAQYGLQDRGRVAAGEGSRKGTVTLLPHLRVVAGKVLGDGGAVQLDTEVLKRRGIHERWRGNGTCRWRARLR